MLLDLDEISAALTVRFSPFGEELADMILTHGGVDLADIELLERELAVVLPDDFRLFLMNYSLDNFSLGSFAFGQGTPYVIKLKELNTENELNQWWGAGERPADLLVIAYSDPYTLCLNTTSGAIYAVTAASDLSDLSAIAKSFDLFFRGAASVFLGAIPAADAGVAANGKDDDFWQSLA